MLLEVPVIEVKVDGAGLRTRSLMWEIHAEALLLGIKKSSYPLIIILNYKNYPTIKLFQTTSYNLKISPSPLLGSWQHSRQPDKESQVPSLPSLWPWICIQDISV